MITRRQFVGGVVGAAATLLLPRLKLVPHYDLHALARKWCASEPYMRFDLTAPYVMQDFAYATDSRAMVRFVDDTLQTDGQLRIPKHTTEVWDSHWHPDGKWFDLPHTLLILNGDDGCCYRCIRANVECPQCAGCGEWVVLPGHRSQRCEACHGSGVVYDPVCPVCHGRYDTQLPSCAVIGDKLFGLEYVSLLRELPGVRLNAAGGSEETPILWESEIGLAGMIMPRTQP